MLKCSFGVAPSIFAATPKMVKSGFMDAGNIMDNKPMVNIPPFGMCSAPTNPAVAAATAAAMGVLTPQPCIPVFPAPWVPGSPTVPVVNFPALNNTSCLNCAYLGIVSIVNPGQMTHDIP